LYDLQFAQEQKSLSSCAAVLQLGSHVSLLLALVASVGLSQGRAKKAVPAQKLWFAIMEAQVETGNPYMLYKDACNRKSNQQNLATIKSSNLCTEIVEFTSPEETAVCNLASIALPRFVREHVSGLICVLYLCICVFGWCTADHSGPSPGW